MELNRQHPVVLLLQLVWLDVLQSRPCDHLLHLPRKRGFLLLQPTFGVLSSVRTFFLLLSPSIVVDLAFAMPSCFSFPFVLSQRSLLPTVIFLLAQSVLPLRLLFRRKLLLLLLLHHHPLLPPPRRPLPLLGLPLPLPLRLRLLHSPLMFLPLTISTSCTTSALKAYQVSRRHFLFSLMIRPVSFRVRLLNSLLVGRRPLKMSR